MLLVVTYRTNDLCLLIFAIFRFLSFCHFTYMLCSSHRIDFDTASINKYVRSENQNLNTCIIYPSLSCSELEPFLTAFFGVLLGCCLTCDFFRIHWPLPWRYSPSFGSYLQYLKVRLDPPPAFRSL
ncbi:hypothetical protein B0H14DRAFT_898855 [Mycena olivaceomarginata]|nr:hypothetical protein B0H14DRAFT_898855 [Mycena olivaceomarginata]